MKKAIAEKWIAALRSKKYKQGQKLLKSKSPRGVVRHCCLGVLCELYQNDRRRKKMKPLPTDSFLPDDDRYDDGVPIKSRVCEFDSFYSTLPPRVVKWAGMHSDEGDFDTPEILPDDSIGSTLVMLNDGGLDFEEIADIIEDRVAEL